MAKGNNDIIGQLLQEVFSDKDGMKRFLEEVVNQAMQGEVAQQLEASEYQRTGRRRGYRNGTKPRKLATRIAASVFVAVKKWRHNGRDGTRRYPKSPTNRFVLTATRNVINW